MQRETCQVKKITTEDGENMYLKALVNRFSLKS